MKCEFVFIGKTTEKYLLEGMDIYLKRLRHYTPVQINILPASTQRTPAAVIEEEAESILRFLKPRDFLVLLDERGKGLSSVEFAHSIDSWQGKGASRLVFLIGGAYGVSQRVSEKAGFILSASRFTFTHQMIRLIILEQFYRAMTILRNEPYHHE